MSGLIELGELRRGDEPEPPAPESRRPPTGSARLVALCYAALLTLAGGAPMPRQPLGVTVPAGRDAIFLAAGDRLVVAERPGTVGDDARLVRGYRLPDAAPLWRFALSAGDEVLGLRAMAGLLLVTSNPPDGSSPRTVALDPGTGEVRWRQPGYPVSTQAGGVLLETFVADGTGTLRAIDPASGTTRWSLPLPHGDAVYGSGDRGVRVAVLLAGDGRAEVYDVDTGALRRSGRLAPAADQVSYRSVQVLGDLLLLDDGSGTVTAYGLDLLDQRWTLSARPESAAWFADCAEVICRRDQTSGLRTYDPATGRPRWSDNRWLDVGRVGDRLLVGAPTVGPAVELAVLDSGTGRTLAWLGRWRLADVDRNGRWLLGFRAVAGHRTVVAELDVSAGQVRYRAVLPGSWGDCAAAAAVVVCLGPTGGLTVWPTNR